MQPVLARAQVMLNHPGEFSVGELERIATEAEHNFLNAETYLESEAVPIDQSTPAITRADIVSALETLQPEFGLQIAGHTSKGTVTVKGLATKPIRLAFIDPVLDADTAARPFTALSRGGPDREPSHAARRDTAHDFRQRPRRRISPIMRLLGRRKRRGTYRDPFRPTDARRRLGRHTTRPEKITAAARHAQREAERQVRKWKATHPRSNRPTSPPNAPPQPSASTAKSAAFCAASTPRGDLAQLATAQAARTGPLEERIRQAQEWLGGRFDWTPQLAWELEQFMRTSRPMTSAHACPAAASTPPSPTIAGRRKAKRSRLTIGEVQLGYCLQDMNSRLDSEVCHPRVSIGR